MGHSQSNINPKKSYYSVEYLNGDFESELNKIIQSNHKENEQQKQTFLTTSIYETLRSSEPNKYQVLNVKSTRSSSHELSDTSSVQRSKSFARPENRVLPPLFQKKQLRQTNLLKNDGSKKTWRNSSKLKKSNSTILNSDNVLKPSLIKSLLNKSIPNLVEKDYDLSSLDSLDQDVNFIDPKMKLSKPKTNDIQIVSRFPINSKIYRHYISGNKDSFDKLTSSIEVSSVLNNFKKDPEPTYDSINEFKSKISSISSSSSFSSITKSSDIFYNFESTKRTACDSSNDSSIFSALTSSSMIHSSHSLNTKHQKRYISSINITRPKFQNDYNNNFNEYNNDTNNDGLSLSSRSLNEYKESNYDFLSNAKSGLSNVKRSVSSKVGIKNSNIFEDTKRLNEIFQTEIQRAYDERTQRFEQAKKVLKSSPDKLVNFKKVPTLRGVDIQSKIRALEENIQKQDFHQSSRSAFKKIEPKKSIIKIETQKQIEIPNFYLRPPVNYDDPPQPNEQDQEVKINFSSREKNSKIKFIEIVDCKRQKYKFVPDDDFSYHPDFFDAPPPPPEYNDDYGFLHSGESLSDSSRDSPDNPPKSNSNFILKPKEMDLIDKEFIPGVILVESQNSKHLTSNNISRSFNKGKRKGLEEIFPEIKLNKQREYENVCKTDAEWCPASDLNDFDLDDSDYESNYHMSMINDNPNYVIRQANFRKDNLFLKKNYFKSNHHQQELNQILEPTVNVANKYDYADILNSIENFYY